MMQIDDLMKIQSKKYTNKSSLDIVYAYLRIAEHNIFLGKVSKAKILLKKLGFSNLTIEKYIISVSEKYDDEEEKFFLKQIFLEKIDKKRLNWKEIYEYN